MLTVLVCVPSLTRSTLEVFEVPEAPGAVGSRRIFDAGVLETPAELDAAIKGLTGKVPGIDLGVFYGPFGGTEVCSPVLVDESVLKRVEELTPRSPMTLPAVSGAMKVFAEHNVGVPAVFDYGSGFFARLPRRERFYAIDPEAARKLGLERTGFHGLFHAAAVAGLRQDATGDTRPPIRTLSICLEPRPEAAAVLDDRPLMVTGGATPLEGLPGQTTCGEIDPGMVLILAQEQHWSPEQIADSLTRESGLLGLVGRPTTLSELFASKEPSANLGREMMLYRLLLATGTAISALGGLDRIVFSGRHAALGEEIGAWLCERLARLPGDVKPRVELLERGFMELLLEDALRFRLEMFPTVPI
ncbi:MAG: acetate kinase [Candidatus Sumerlaeota bacterium]|nr:acetate kinase [Candidatus Sumerlaeota bacterium]